MSVLGKMGDILRTLNTVFLPIFGIAPKYGELGSSRLDLSEMYNLYKLLYQLKIELRRAVDYKFTNDWHDLGHGYDLWTKQFSWEHPLRIRRKRPGNTTLGPSRFLLEFVYPRVPKDASDLHPGKVLRRRLRESQEDYYFFARPQGDDAELAFKSSHLPKLFNMGLGIWEEEATKVILSSMEVAYDRKHWKWY
ncbi:c2b2808c-0d1d-4ff1-ae77-872dc7e68091-CDS [Sclerotinia trifoliorum]|uniref:C2b2808c-0d1d-4ff1-ae77-872dc7e68091-CDS n=1 Tax=Sclerotinia trifoliorum TaxID=28548 RepID=A0A8H2W1J8_9HELO|nr:c2b2808c-0d1d-4ff1-ae77-872dc7e68091-CDS [Sclerotinia trifoliorum]